MDKLDEKGFVFLDGNYRPFLCATLDGNPWIFYWHPDNHWVTLRQVSQVEIWSYPHNLTKEHQELYRKAHSEYNQSLQTDAVVLSAVG